MTLGEPITDNLPKVTSATGENIEDGVAFLYDGDGYREGVHCEEQWLFLHMDKGKSRHAVLIIAAQAVLWLHVDLHGQLYNVVNPLGIRQRATQNTSGPHPFASS